MDKHRFLSKKHVACSYSFAECTKALETSCVICLSILQKLVSDQGKGTSQYSHSPSPSTISSLSLSSTKDHDVEVDDP